MGPKLSKISYKMSEHEKQRGYSSENEGSKERDKCKIEDILKTDGDDKLPDGTEAQKPRSSGTPSDKKENVFKLTLKNQKQSCALTNSKDIKSSTDRNKKKSKSKDPQPSSSSASTTSTKVPLKKSRTWLFKSFNRKETEHHDGQESSLSENSSSSSCVCTAHRRTSSDVLDGSSSNPIPPPPVPANHVQESNRAHVNPNRHCTSSLLRLFNPEDYPIEDEDERLRRQRAKEIEEGVELTDKLSTVALKGNKENSYHQVHTQVDFIHCLVPDLKEITSCSFYWGKIDRYEAEKLLEGKPEGTFLLRDSAQEEYLFSVSFRRYGRSLHARIEQWNHRFSFDAHDPTVFSSPTVTGLLEHYKDASVCMFFEPMLTIRLHRNFTFSLHHLARSVICNHIKYDDVNQLPLPKPLKAYCKEYHYKQRVRVRTFAD